jgi:hypothetical protein
MWKLKASERITHWREFRKQLEDLTLEQAVESVADFWQTCPFTPYYLEAGQPTEWPDPWTLLADNYYCDLAKCLGIVYTVALTKHITAEPEIHIYRDSETRLTYHLAVFDQGKYVINLVDGEVVNIKSLNKTMQLQYRYTRKDLKIE